MLVSDQFLGRHCNILTTFPARPCLQRHGSQRIPVNTSAGPHTERVLRLTEGGRGARVSHTPRELDDMSCGTEHQASRLVVKTASKQVWNKQHAKPLKVKVSTRQWLSNFFEHAPPTPQFVSLINNGPRFSTTGLCATYMSMIPIFKNILIHLSFNFYLTTTKQTVNEPILSFRSAFSCQIRLENDFVFFKFTPAN